MPRRRPAFVRLHPLDRGTGLAPAFFEDPATFQPQRCPHTGKLERWGIVDAEDDAPGGGMLPASMMRTMQVQQFYFGTETPERQFVGELIKRKQAALEAARPRAAPLYKRDFVVDLELVLAGKPLRPRVWRRLRVSGGTPLHALADKVLLPAMGFTRNYHGCLWTDYRDGAVLGDQECASVDMMHVGMHYFSFMDCRPWKLADLLQEPGQELGFTYDLGDHWRHLITCVEVLPEGESSGAAALLDGGGACPPEDSNGLDGMGCHAYQELLDQLQQPGFGAGRAWRKARAEASSAMNYRDDPAGFHPDRFDLAAAQRRLADALASRASVSSGAKQFCMPLMPGLGGVYGDSGGPGRRVEHRAEASGAVLTETVATGKDPKAVAVCYQCGSPHNLLNCAGCRLVRFCGKECQVASWGRHKAECRAEQKRRAAAAAGGAGSSS